MVAKSQEGTAIFPLENKGKMAAANEYTLNRKFDCKRCQRGRCGRCGARMLPLQIRRLRNNSEGPRTLIKSRLVRLVTTPVTTDIYFYLAYRDTNFVRYCRS